MQVDYSTPGWLKFLSKLGGHMISLDDAGRFDVVKSMMDASSDVGQKTWAAREANFALLWAEVGCPQVVVSDKVFAELAMGWDLSGVALDVPLPWPHFIIRIPNSLKPELQWGLDAEKDRAPVSHIRVETRRDVCQTKYQWTLQPEGDMSGTWGIGFDSIGDLASEVFSPKNSHGIFKGDQNVIESIPPNSWDAINVLMNLTGVVILEMMHPRHSAKLDRCKSTCEKRAKDLDHRPTTLELVRPVTVDLRDVLRDVMTPAEDGAPAKKRAKVKLQSLIRGHYKRQRYGKGNAQVKYIYVDPYWRGPADAPIAVREHILKA